ncbi:CobW family GTP-binding protein [Chamaesiphon minutus]|uniref:Putative GTPase, G3E family n=1 Tax=Chamaesiphon minutus (strain ATCC 27169 / PCC 6605) TaxID=1173020 RepID=K9UEX1_CHAP6|nr:GTP-binding protein [Chamaesiphon minutus]AFY93198.1 putative GTPase, G3E family [Chamaesiphon minutus PCC 6605]
MTQTITHPTTATLEIPKRGMPVTIITGFLGSGKTTLLNHILSDRKGLKIAVLVNEFGDINIDSQLLVSMEDGMLELSNGCICCTINEDLVEAVYRVLEREEKVDYMVIETTGVADPLPIILTFLGTELRDMTRLDSIVTMVDSETFTPEHFDSEAAFKQITYADITILNKTDLARKEQILDLESYIKSVKEGARILHSEHGQVPLDLILDVEYNNPNNYAGLVEEEIEQTEQDIHSHKHHAHEPHGSHDAHQHEHHAHESHESHDAHQHEHHAHESHESHQHEHPHEHDEHHHNHEHHAHEHHHHHSSHLDNDGFVSISFEGDRPFDVKKFETFLQLHLPSEVFRAKGILWFTNSEDRHIFQLSGARFNLNGEPWQSSPKNQLVFIGRNLDADNLRQQLTDCFA